MRTIAERLSSSISGCHLAIDWKPYAGNVKGNLAFVSMTNGEFALSGAITRLGMWKLSTITEECSL